MSALGFSTRSGTAPRRILRRIDAVKTSNRPDSALDAERISGTSRTVAPVHGDLGASARERRASALAAIRR